MEQDSTWYGGIGLGDILFDGDPAPLSQKRGTAAPTIRFMYCGQMAGWNKMPLGMEIGLGPGHIVLDGDWEPSSPKKGTGPNFRPMFLVAKWLDGPRLHLVRRPRPRRHFV